MLCLCVILIIYYCFYTPSVLVNGWKIVDKSRIIKLKQGDIVGLIAQPNNHHLNKVEQFLGIPYAAPPVGSLRFMPPGSPPHWPGTKIADKLAPVCHQVSSLILSCYTQYHYINYIQIYYLLKL
ncbi:hypothetical protein O3M35_000609 [Rhynocoris fuscipes]|uniref:Carboxylesterase type B domain-containing protein n=1 Tax=Rhynocoris fuscipes TaxID=488301 RepID=A0AAW1DS95_9HEMI